MEKCHSDKQLKLRTSPKINESRKEKKNQTHHHCMFREVFRSIYCPNPSPSPPLTLPEPSLRSLPGLHLKNERSGARSHWHAVRGRRAQHDRKLPIRSGLHTQRTQQPPHHSITPQKTSKQKKHTPKNKQTNNPMYACNFLKQQ